MDVILGPILRILDMAIGLYIWIVVIGVILSWLVAFNVVNTQNRFIYMFMQHNIITNVCIKLQSYESIIIFYMNKKAMYII